MISEPWCIDSLTKNCSAKYRAVVLGEPRFTYDTLTEPCPCVSCLFWMSLTFTTHYSIGEDEGELGKSVGVWPSWDPAWAGWPGDHRAMLPACSLCLHKGRLRSDPVQHPSMSSHWRRVKGCPGELHVSWDRKGVTATKAMGMWVCVFEYGSLFNHCFCLSVSWILLPGNGQRWDGNMHADYLRKTFEGLREERESRH